MIYQILITSLVTWGVFGATRKGMILYFIKKWGDQHLPHWITYPMYDCPKCMASVWSIVLTAYFGITLELLLVIPSVSGINYIIMRLFPYTDE